jgi:RNA polymerase sigma-70 factor (ECF subfamily)
MTTDFAELTDRELWEQARAGSGSAFGWLFDRHARAVYNHCFRLVASWAAAEDLLQSTFLVAWRKRDGVTLTHDSARPWLLAVATNVARSDRRAGARRLRLAGRALVEGVVPDHADDVAGRVDDERRMTEVLAAARKLPRNQQEALALCVWSGVSYAEDAVVLGIAEVSVRARVSKASARLRGLLAPVVTLTTVTRRNSDEHDTASLPRPAAAPARRDPRRADVGTGPVAASLGRASTRGRGGRGRPGRVVRAVEPGRRDGARGWAAGQHRAGDPGGDAGRDRRHRAGVRPGGGARGQFHAVPADP